MSGYEWLPPPEPIASECCECGHVTYHDPELPRFGPMTLAEQRQADRWAKMAEALNASLRAAYTPERIADYLTPVDIGRMVRG